MKKTLSLLLSTIIIILFVAPSAAATYENTQQYEFTFPDGQTISYYLDNNGMPYEVVNGERVFIALPLTHLELTDDAVISELNAQLKGTKSSAIRSIPTNCYPLTNGNANKSNVYSSNVSFDNVQTVYTPIFKLDTRHNSMRIRSTNIVKPLLGSSKIAFLYMYYSVENDRWYQLDMLNVNCKSVSGYGFRHSPSVFQYGRFVLLLPDDVTSYTVNIWTTLAS